MTEHAALDAAISDAYATSLESKFYYNFWRPLPDYPSAHAAAGAAAAEAINYLAGANLPFQHTSTSAPAAPAL